MGLGAVAVVDVGPHQLFRDVRVARDFGRCGGTLAGTGAMAEVVHNRAGSRSTTLRGLG